MAYTEFEAIVELLGRLVLEPRTGVLMLALLIAAAIDVRSNRVPNRLIAAGMMFALIYNGGGFAVADNALSIPFLRENGWLISLQGMAIGFGLFLPLYLARAMGAGDVKLMAMTGTFVGPGNATMAVLWTVLAGGALAVGFVLWTGTVRQTFQNVLALVRGNVLTAPIGVVNMEISASASVGKLPYGVAIAGGTIAYLVLKQLGIVAW